MLFKKEVGVILTMLLAFVVIIIFEKILGLSMLESRFSWFSVWFLWIIANALDVHSTHIFTKKDGHFENEANFLAKFLMKRLGFGQAILLLKIPIVLNVGVVSMIFFGSNLLLMCSVVILSVAIYNYWPVLSEP